MEKEFVSYELAVKLKELGFDESCFGYYEPNKNLNYIEEHILKDVPYLAKNSEWQDLCAAPTYSQAFKWFRENYKLHSHISLSISDEQDRSGLEYDEYIYVIEGVNGLDYDNYNESFFYKTHEEAELECLKKLIEIVENKE